MATSTDESRPMSAAEAAAHFAEERKRHGAKHALMSEAKMDIETVVAMIDAMGEKGLRRKKAREFAAAFELPDSLLPEIETLFYGDLDSRKSAGREIWKYCDSVQKGAARE